MVRTRILAALALTILSSQAFGALLPVNSSQFPVAAEPDPVGGAVVASAITPFTASTFTGVLTSKVISGDTSNPFGGLTFTYLIHNDSSSPNSIGRITVNNFAGFLTDVSYQTPASGVAPSLADRDSTGNIMGFSFFSPNALTPGTNSALLVIQTNATSFAATPANLIDGSTAQASSFAPVPEPASLSLAVVGGMALLARRRRG